MFLRTTPTCTYEPPGIITFAWVFNYWSIDANIYDLSPLMNTSVNTLKPNIVNTQLEANSTIKVAKKYLSATTAMVVMDPYEAKDLMRFNAIVVLNGLSCKADTLIDTATSLNFARNEFVVANGFYKDCKTALKLTIRSASEQRISTTKMFCPSVFTIYGHEFPDLQFRVLSHFKSPDIILGLLALKQLNVGINPSLNIFTIDDFTINCNRETRRIICMIVNSDKMDQKLLSRPEIRKNLVTFFLYLFTLLRTWHPLRVTLEINLINNSNNSSRSLQM